MVLCSTSEESSDSASFVSDDDGVQATADYIYSAVGEARANSRYIGKQFHIYTC